MVLTPRCVSQWDAMPPACRFSPASQSTRASEPCSSRSSTGGDVSSNVSWLRLVDEWSPHEDDAEQAGMPRRRLRGKQAVLPTAPSDGGLGHGRSENACVGAQGSHGADAMLQGPARTSTHMPRRRCRGKQQPGPAWLSASGHAIGRAGNRAVPVAALPDTCEDADPLTDAPEPKRAVHDYNKVYGVVRKTFEAHWAKSHRAFGPRGGMNRDLRSACRQDFGSFECCCTYRLVCEDCGFKQ